MNNYNELLYKIIGQKYSTIMYRPDIVAIYCNIIWIYKIVPQSYTDTIVLYNGIR